MTAFSPVPTPPQCLPSSCFTLQHRHTLTFYMPTSLHPCQCLSDPTVQTLCPTPLPTIHTSMLASPLLPVSSRSGKTQCFQIQALQPHLAIPVLRAGMAEQSKAITVKQRLRSGTLRSCWLQLSLRRQKTVTFCMHPCFSLLNASYGDFGASQISTERELFIAAAGFPPAETCHCWPLLYCVR